MRPDKQTVAQIDVSDSSVVAIAVGNSTATVNLVTRPRLPTQFQVPAQPKYFIGRSAQVDELEHLVTSRVDCVVGVYGMSGVGKTALVTVVAHRLRDHFPDGVLWVRMDNTSLFGVLGSIAESLGFDLGKVDEVDNRASIVRSLLTDKRVLLVLDNVLTVATVEPFMITGGQSSIIVTSLDSSLLSTSKAQTMLVPELPPDDAIKLFHEIAKTSASDREAVAAICSLLGGLPLAIMIAASTVAYYDVSAQQYLAMLKSSQAMLAQLQYQNLNVRSSFEIGWGLLSAKEKEIFAALGMFRSVSFHRQALAHILGLPEVSIRGSLGRLRSLSLVNAEGADDYSLHPLIREFARDKLEQLELLTTLRQRHSEWFLRYAQENSRRYTQLAKYREDILYGMEWAEETLDWKSYAEFVEALSFFLVARYELQVYEDMCRKPLSLSMSDPQLPGLSYLQSGVGYVERIRKNYSESLIWFDRAIETASLAGADSKNMMYLHEKGAVLSEMGQYEGARENLNRSVEIATRLGNELRVAKSYHELGILDLKLGAHDSGLELLQHSIEIKRAQGDLPGVAFSLLALAEHYYKLGNLQQSLDTLKSTRAIQEHLGDNRRIEQTYLLTAQVLIELADWTNALDMIRLAIENGKSIMDEASVTLAEALRAKVERAMVDSSSHVLDDSL